MFFFKLTKSKKKLFFFRITLQMLVLDDQDLLLLLGQILLGIVLSVCHSSQGVLGEVITGLEFGSIP